MPVSNGTYVPKNEKTVSHWPAPDKDGDGPEIMEDQYDNAGNYIGRNYLKDGAGNVLRHYAPPEGFRNFPGFDNTDNYVAVDERGSIRRTPTGEAINIKPGRTVVEHSTGHVEYLDDDHARYRFEQSHSRVEGDA